MSLVKVQKAEVPVYFNFLFLEITNVEGPVLESLTKALDKLFWAVNEAQ